MDDGSGVLIPLMTLTQANLRAHANMGVEAVVAIQQAAHAFVVNAAHLRLIAVAWHARAHGDDVVRRSRGSPPPHVADYLFSFKSSS